MLKLSFCYCKHVYLLNDHPIIDSLFSSSAASGPSTSSVVILTRPRRIL